MQLKQLVVPTILLFIFFVYVCPASGFTWDLDVFKSWGDYISEFGIGNIFYTNADLPPDYYYILKLNHFIWGNETPQAFYAHIKLYTVFVELIGIFIVLYAVKDKERRFLHWSLLALNIAYFYDSLIWGQIDGFASTLNFAAIFLAYRKNWTAAICVFVLSLNFKVQSIMFFPLLFILFANDFKNISKKKILSTVFAALLVQVILLFPFLHPGKLKQVAHMITSSVGRNPSVSMNAANIWQWIFPKEDLIAKSDLLLFMNVSLRNWGLLMMGVSLLYAFYPILKSTFQKIFRKVNSQINFDQIMLLGALTPLLFFFFNTEMHERYTHNAWLFIAAYALKNKRYIVLILFSVTYYLNLEFILDAVRGSFTFSWSFQFIAALFGVLIIYLLRELYSNEKKKELQEVLVSK